MTRAAKASAWYSWRRDHQWASGESQNVGHPRQEPEKKQRRGEAAGLEPEGPIKRLLPGEQ